jgi:hypothetical protein
LSLWCAGQWLDSAILRSVRSPGSIGDPAIGGVLVNRPPQPLLRILPWGQAFYLGGSPEGSARKPSGQGKDPMSAFGTGTGC